MITPHVYPPTITHATFLGETLWEQCRASFGYLQTQGFCPEGGAACRVFPIHIGETGSAFEAEEDKQWLNDFADFINAKVWGDLGGGRRCARMLTACVCSGGTSSGSQRPSGPKPVEAINLKPSTPSLTPHPPSPQGKAAEYNNVPANGWAWWAYNENSGDTGGIVYHYWQDINWWGAGPDWGAAFRGLGPPGPSTSVLAHAAELVPMRSRGGASPALLRLAAIPPLGRLTRVPPTPPPPLALPRAKVNWMIAKFGLRPWYLR